eukprot:TRINITY_DN5235_c0_g1_i6.p1 TRINITY_DN5235_c0_g1~~TRINITY_DN5235_c0_g1_i6.p1  ORF type:complete len:197 (-),score=54.90 TRINITY_DN5235_c0_g1_i6:128-718(-)
MFMETMKKEFAAENLLFWKAVHTFQRKYPSTTEINTQELIDDAVKIYKEFISEDTRDQVNLPGEQIEELKKIFTDGFTFPKGINQWVFNNAYQSILHLMYRDNFSRFKFSEQGKQFLEGLPPYCPSDYISPMPLATVRKPPEMVSLRTTPLPPSIVLGKSKKAGRIEKDEESEGEGLLNPTTLTSLFSKKNKKEEK